MTDHYNARDTRPDWMLDPSIGEIDEDAIALVGQQITDNIASQVSNEFINRSTVEPDGGSGTSTTSGGTPSTDAPPTGGAPTVDGVAPSTGTTTEPTTEPTTDAPTTFSVQVPGAQSVEINNEQALALIQQHNWLVSRPQAVQEAWGAIEQGTHRAVPLQDFAAFEAWRASGQPASQPPVTRVPRPNMHELDPDVAEYLHSLEAAIPNAQSINPATQQQTTQSTIDAPPTAQQIMLSQQEAVNRQVALQTALTATRETFQKQYNLDQSQLDQLSQAVAQANIIPAIAAKYRTMNPLGTAVMAEGDPNQVIGEAFESVMATHPQFRTIRDDAIYNARLIKDRELNSRVDGKKALASSLAHAPSAAVSSNPGTSKSIEQMTPQERQAAMTAEIAEAIANGTFSQ